MSWITHILHLLLVGLTRATVLGVLGGVIGLFAYAAFWLPDVRILADNNPTTSSFMEQARLRAHWERDNMRLKYDWTPLQDISTHLQRAVLIAEDDRFYQHPGIDTVELWKAIVANYKAWKWVRGASTITQQLAKNLYLSPERNLIRKFNELLLTIKLEQNLSKDRILEVYLNVVEWGGGCFGAEAASRHYFYKSASELTINEAAYLAALLPNPDFLRSSQGKKRLQQRENMILTRLNKRGYVPVSKSDIQLAKSPKPPTPVSVSRSKPIGDMVRALPQQISGAVGSLLKSSGDKPLTVVSQIGSNHSIDHTGLMEQIGQGISGAVEGMVQPLSERLAAVLPGREQPLAPQGEGEITERTSIKKSVDPPTAGESSTIPNLPSHTSPPHADSSDNGQGHRLQSAIMRLESLLGD